MPAKLHASFGVLALLLLACFWTSTMVAEFLLDWPAVAAVKGAIVTGLFLLIPAMILAGMSGGLSARGRSGRLITTKARRMKILAANGLLVMLPSALFLDAKASAGEADLPFYGVQAVELVVGAVQMALMILNARDGLRLKRQP